jgi:uncharacterized protein
MGEPQRQATRILSLDGGGTWALIQARALQVLFEDEDAKGWDILARFDLVVANSGGSIVAGGLVANKKLSEIVSLFEDLARRESVFKRKSFDFIRRSLPVPRYRTAAKRAGLLGLLGDRANIKMSDWNREQEGRRLADIVITAFDYDRERATYFRTNTASLASTGSATSADATFLDAIHASTTPPVVFFDEPAEVQTSDGIRKYWDGAMAGYNNPIDVGVVEALANAPEGEPSGRRIRVLSLGTGTVPHPPNYRSPTGLFSDIKKAALSILDDPPDTATFVAHVTLRGDIPTPEQPLVSNGPSVRMNPVARVGTPGVSKEEYDALSNIHLDAIEPADVARIISLTEKWLRDEVPNQPIRPATGNDPADIGHDKFSEAKAACLAWL